MKRSIPLTIILIFSSGLILVIPTLEAQALQSMVFIPGGEFEMGDHYGVGYADELPLHDVYIDSFYMDIFEVTNRHYCDYLNSAYGQGLIEVDYGIVWKKDDSESYCETDEFSIYSMIHWDGSTFTVATGKEGHPMIEVSWYGAAAYANWRSEQERRPPGYDLDSWEYNFDPVDPPIKVRVWLEDEQYHVGYRLPTEADWEYAARGIVSTGGENPDFQDHYYKYPWGNNFDGSKANYYYSGDPYESGAYPWTTPVGYYDGNQTPPGSDMANGYGLYDMAGNAAEWCHDRWSLDYYSVSPYDNPRGPVNGNARVLRGGSWDYSGRADVDYYLRCADRVKRNPDYRYEGQGFRLVLPAE